MHLSFFFSLLLLFNQAAVVMVLWSHTLMIDRVTATLCYISKRNCSQCLTDPQPEPRP